MFVRFAESIDRHVALESNRAVKFSYILRIYRQISQAVGTSSSVNVPHTSRNYVVTLG